MRNIRAVKRAAHLACLPKSSWTLSSSVPKAATFQFPALRCSFAPRRDLKSLAPRSLRPVVASALCKQEVKVAGRKKARFSKLSAEDALAALR
jgi:hypothetical protein